MTVLLLSALIVTLAAGDLFAAEFEPVENYETRTIQGWTVRVNRALLDSEDDLAERTLREMEYQLYQVVRGVGEDKLAKLRETPIWVEATSSVTCMCYHPSKQWLREHDFNPQKAKAIELGNPQHFLSWTRHQFWMVFHELAHSYHDRVLGWDDDKVKQAYAHARQSGLYEKVINFAGKRGRAYTLNNHKEYFAELSEAYFGCNDWYPFVRAELQDYDPVGFEMMQSIWGRPK